MNEEQLAQIIKKAYQRLIEEPSVSRWGIVEYIEDKIKEQLSDYQREEFEGTVYTDITKND